MHIVAPTLDLRGCELFPSTRADAIAAQTAGQALDRNSAGPLRDDISTDEIRSCPSAVAYGRILFP
jgi:hypothetical protein